MSVTKPPPQQPSLLWRTASTFVMASTGILCRAFLYGLNDVQVTGLDKFLALLDSRRNVEARERGLITVSNHISVADDPLLWGVLPLRYAINYQNLRWSLGAHDICYRNSLTGHFFLAGQTLPTHRLRHSPFGGPWQPTMTEAVRLLSATPGPASRLPRSLADLQPAMQSLASLSSSPSSSPPSPPPPPPQSSPPSPWPAPPPPDDLHYSTNGVDRWPSPAAFASNRMAWVHVFPEGGVQQEGNARELRYFRWGVARLILESDPAPEVVPMFIDGFDGVMPEDRSFPRFLPRIAQRIHVVFGDALGPDAFADLRARWRDLQASAASTAASTASAASAASASAVSTAASAGTCEAVQNLRIEVAQRVRNEILKLRRRMGYPDEDPVMGLADTWVYDAAENTYRSKRYLELVKEQQQQQQQQKQQHALKWQGQKSHEQDKRTP